MCTLTRETLGALRLAQGFSIYAHDETAEITIDLESWVGGKPYDEIARVRFALGLAIALPGKVAFMSCSSCRYDYVWPTIVSLLRVGDKFSVAFREDWLSNGYVRAAQGPRKDHKTGDNLIYDGLHADCCDLVIERKGRRLVFRLDVSIAPDNTARMIRRNH